MELEHTPTKALIGERIKAARAARKDISATRIAAALDVSPDTLARYEKGETEPSYRQVVILSQLLERPLDWFVGEDAAA